MFETILVFIHFRVVLEDEHQIGSENQDSKTLSESAGEGIRHADAHDHTH
ncbi:MAG: hypothetical protein OEZ68_06920 [Gammaproteobacteria bacterium]|nr:hypothetical protein [Gammaproteobacteria bacterium]MDH5800521.1 hypothetical protein [Gammaproteobacteria bacterium]